MNKKIEYIHILQIGCGGTGGYLVLPLSKYLRSLHHTGNYSMIQYTLADGDIVEPKNIARQNFTKDDIGKNKAEVLSERYSDIYFTIYPFGDFLNDYTMSLMISDMNDIAHNRNTLIIVIGCVDSIDSRKNIVSLVKAMSKDILTLSDNTYYIDSGNYLYNGQIKVFRLNNIEEEFEEYFNDNYSIDMDSKKESCSENGDQSILMNFRCADLLYSLITDIITRNGNCRVNEIQTTRYVVTPDNNNLVELIEEST